MTLWLALGPVSLSSLRCMGASRRSLGWLFAWALGACGAGAAGGPSTAASGEAPLEFEDEADARRSAPSSEAVARAEALLAQGHAEDAIDVLRRALAADSRDARAHLDLGIAHEMLEQGEPAERAYRAALEIEPEFPEALNNLGALLRDSDRGAEGTALLRRAIAARPGLASAHLNLAFALEEAGDLDGAIAAYRRVTELSPRDPSSRANLGMLLLEQGQQAQALIELRRALPLASGSRADLAQIGTGLRRAGDPDLAVRALREAVSAEDSPAPPGLRAELCLGEFAAGQRSEAEAHVRALIVDVPDYAVAHWVLANMLAARRAFPEAAAEYQTFVRMAPEAPEAAEARRRLAFVRAQR